MGKAISEVDANPKKILDINISRNELHLMCTLIKQSLTAFREIEDTEIMIRFNQKLKVENEITKTLQDVELEKAKEDPNGWNGSEFTKKALADVNTAVNKIGETKIKLSLEKFEESYWKRMPGVLGPVLDTFYDLFH